MKERCGRCEEYKPSEAGHSGRLATINIVPEIKRQEKMIPVTESRARESCCFMRGSRTSAGRSSLPGRSPAGSFRGPRAS